MTRDTLIKLKRIQPEGMPPQSWGTLSKKPKPRGKQKRTKSKKEKLLQLPTTTKNLKWITELSHN